MANKANKPYVRIQSSMSIHVTMGLNNQNVTNPDAHVPDRLKVNPLWPKATVLIKKGTGIYPSEIVEWNTVKALAKDKILTIGEFLDKGEDEAIDSTVEEGKEDLTRVIEEIKKKQTLKDIAGD